MNQGFIKSFFPILRRLKKFKIEIGLIIIAFLIAIISLVIYFHSNQNDQVNEDVSEKIFSEPVSKIFVDIAGAVERPGVYEATYGARLKDIIMQAGGFSQDAEINYISRNFNLAKIVSDQEKIYIPSKFEINTGIFTEPQRFLDYTYPTNNQTVVTENPKTQKININSASIEELDTLPGIGKITAEKIIKNRPYQTIEELLTKKVVKKNVYEQIKQLISLN